MIRDFKSRKIPELSSKGRPARLLFLDTETKTKKVIKDKSGQYRLSNWSEGEFDERDKESILHRFDLGWSCFERYSVDKGFSKAEWQLWHSSKLLCEYLQAKTRVKEPLFVFAHNIFFDLQAGDFFYWFTRWGWVLDFVYDKGTTYILVIHKEGKTIKCISTTNYFPFTLERLGHFLGLPKLDIDFVKSLRSEGVRYCWRDTEIVKKAIEYYIGFLDKYDLGKFSLARPSQALTAYRYRFMTTPIYRHREEDIMELERGSYFGGRVECGFIGDLPRGEYISLDVNSMYPYVMKRYKFPTKLVDYRTQVTIREIPEILKTFAVVARVLICTDSPLYPVRRKGKLVFPTGDFETVLCSGSLLEAYKRGHLRCIIEMSAYDKGDIFKEYVSFFIRLKERYSREGSLILREITKDFLNHLYGKFAQQKDVVEEIEDITYNGYWREEVLDLVTGRSEVTTKLFNKQITTFGKAPTTSYFVAIAAHITDYARLHLYQMMETVGLDRVLYVDTDSIKIRKEDLPKLAKYIDPVRLGKLKIEDEFTEFSIYGAKYYITEKGKKIKGIPLKAEYLGDKKYRYTQFGKQTTHLRASVTRFFITKSVTKSVPSYYDKGKVLKDGRVIPLDITSS